MTARRPLRRAEDLERLFRPQGLWGAKVSADRFAEEVTPRVREAAEVVAAVADRLRGKGASS